MAPQNRQPEELSPADAELLELYLDGQLSEDRAVIVERRIAAEPLLQAVVERQEQLDASLGELFQSPALNAEFLEKLATESDLDQDEQPATVLVRPAKPEATKLDATRPAWRQQGLAVAAMLACVLVWTFYGWDEFIGLVSPEGGYEQITVARLYQDAVEDGFKPEWLCEDDQEFAQTFYDRQGTGLLLKPLPDGVRMAGLAYREGFTKKATSMFAYVDDKPVLLVAARTSEVERGLLKNDTDQQLSVFTRKLGDLTLVEVSPLEGPQLLDSVYEADVPDQPTGHVPGTPVDDG